MRSFQPVTDETGEVILEETRQSRENRGVSPNILTKEERLALKAHALKTWAEWGIMADA